MVKDLQFTMYDVVLVAGVVANIHNKRKKSSPLS